MAPRHRLSLRHHNQEDDEARQERGSNEPDRRLLALNLLRFASSDASVSVRMLDRGDERYMGPAYSYEADYLLLNVPAGRMGAFSEDPEFALHESAHREPVGGTTCDHVRAEVLTSP